jgi:hypothetical protein
MHVRICIVAPAIFVAAATAAAAGDFESKLLQKYQNSNKTAADKLRREVTEDLARSISGDGDDRAILLDKVRGDLRRLRDESYLPKDERLSMINQLQDRERSLKEDLARLAPKKPDLLFQASAQKPPTEQPDRWHRVGQGFGGAGFSVTPVVSSNRRYVRIGILGLFGFHLINTTVAVPDGGTVAVDTYRSVSEGRSEFGPPGLSNIPYLDRLFRNTGYGRTTRRTGLSASVRIISMEEEEERFRQMGGGR